jgi:hypothetical protein
MIPNLGGATGSGYSGSTMTVLRNQCPKVAYPSRKYHPVRWQIVHVNCGTALAIMNNWQRELRRGTIPNSIVCVVVFTVSLRQSEQGGRVERR